MGMLSVSVSSSLAKNPKPAASDQGSVVSVRTESRILRLFPENVQPAAAPLQEA
jgi:hypothetical protein